MGEFLLGGTAPPGRRSRYTIGRAASTRVHGVGVGYYRQATALRSATKEIEP